MSVPLRDPHEGAMQQRATARVDLTAIRDNVARLRTCAGAAGVMAVVKANGYGHGMLPSARAALAGGATWLGVAVVEEALALRAAGVGERILSWLAAPGEKYDAALRADVDLSASAVWTVEEVAAAAERTGRPARVHLKVDSGLGRAGAAPGDWPELVAAARKAELDGQVRVVGVWSHFAYADAPGHPTIAGQIRVFREAVEVAEQAGICPEARHLANSAATLTLPEAHLDLVRPGLAVYGLSPVPRQAASGDLGLRPAMTLLARLALVKRVPAGQGVSYGHRYTTQQPTTLGLIPVGYADGIPRNATNAGPMLVAGRVRPVAGAVCMDQVVVDLGDDEAAAGDGVVFFGPGDHGEPTAQDWADALGTISYEIVSRIGERVPRTYTDVDTGAGGAVTGVAEQASRTCTGVDAGEA